MPMDGVMLGLVARELKGKLVGGRVDRINQPERDELDLMIRCQGENVTLLLSASASNARVHLTQQKHKNPMEPPMFCMLLRKHLTSARVVDVRQYGGDRILEIEFEHYDEFGDLARKTLVCELMGKHSNIIFIDSTGRIIDSARHVTEEMSRVRDVLPGLRYERPPQQEKLPYDALDAEALCAKWQGCDKILWQALSDCITGLSAFTARELACRLAGEPTRPLTQCGDLVALAQEVVRFFARLPEIAKPVLLLKPDGSVADFASLMPMTRTDCEARIERTFSAVMDAYFFSRDRAERIQQKSASLYKTLKNNISRCEKKLSLQMLAIDDSARMEEYRIKGELLTASAYMAVKGAKEVLLPNYYDPDCALLRVELDEKLSPAQNAQRYFKLYKKARSAQVLAVEQRRMTEEELAYLEGQLDNLIKCTEEAELNEIREELEREGYVRKSHNRRQIKQLPPSLPMRFVSSDGTDILVGKNNLQNDKLTFSAKANEYWLHVKNMPGSHVIVASTEPSEQTLYEAAMLAAYFSKGKNSSGVPVDVTRRRYVKKPSGAKPGFVIYTNQHTLSVTPREELVKRLAYSTQSAKDPNA